MNQKRVIRQDRCLFSRDYTDISRVTGEQHNLIARLSEEYLTLSSLSTKKPTMEQERGIIDHLLTYFGPESIEHWYQMLIREQLIIPGNFFHSFLQF